MNKEENIFEFLSAVKKVIDTIGKNYIDIFEDILTSDSEYDKLFYGYAARYNVSIENLKEECINIIGKNNLKTNIEKYFKKEPDKIKEEQKQSLNDNKNLIYEDLYSIIQKNISKIVTDINQLKEEFTKQENIIPDLNLFYSINYKEERKYIILYITSIVYEWINFYEDKYDMDSQFAISLMANNTDLCLKIFINYLNTPKTIKDIMMVNIINKGKIKELLKICPFSFFELRKIYNLKFEGEKLDSIKIGQKTIEYVDYCIKDCYDGIYKEKDIYSNALLLINSRYQEENIEKWFSYLTANIYQNLSIKKESLTDDELKFINIINSNYIVFNKDFSIYVIRKFYEINKDLFDENVIYNLNNSINEEVKEKTKIINPYYEQEKRYLKK